MGIAFSSLRMRGRARVRFRRRREWIELDRTGAGRRASGRGRLRIELSRNAGSHHLRAGSADEPARAGPEPRAVAELFVAAYNDEPAAVRSATRGRCKRQGLSSAVRFDTTNCAPRSIEEGAAAPVTAAFRKPGPAK